MSMALEVLRELAAMERRNRLVSAEDATLLISSESRALLWADRKRQDSALGDETVAEIPQEQSGNALFPSG